MSDFWISNKDWDKIINYARAREEECGDEIGGMAIAKQDKDGDWILSEPTILKQETTGGTCTLDKDELAQFYADKAAKHGINIQFVWWHSHAKMDAFWSGTDTATMKEYQAGNWSMFLVVNVREEYKFRVQYWKPFELGEDIELNIIDKKNKYKVPKSIMKEVSKKCNKASIVNYSYRNNVINRQTNMFQQTPIPISSETNSLLDEFESSMVSGGISNPSSTIESEPIEFLIWQLEEGNAKFIDGRVNYKRYKDTLEQFNDTLRRLEGPNSPKLRVQIYPEKVLMDTIMTSFAHDFITLNGQSIQEVYDNHIEKDADALSWNASFGVGGYL